MIMRRVNAFHQKASQEHLTLNQATLEKADEIANVCTLYSVSDGVLGDCATVISLRIVDSTDNLFKISILGKLEAVN